MVTGRENIGEVVKRLVAMKLPKVSWLYAIPMILTLHGFIYTSAFINILHIIYINQFLHSRTLSEISICGVCMDGIGTVDQNMWFLVHVDRRSKVQNSWNDRDVHRVNLSSQAFIWCVIMVAFSTNLPTFPEESSRLEGNTCMPCVYIVQHISHT